MNGFLLTTFRKRKGGMVAVPPPPPPPPEEPTFTPASLIHTNEELAVLRPRLLDIHSYRGDKQGIIDYANLLRGNPYSGRYIGPTRTKEGVALAQNDPIETDAKPEAGNTGTKIVRCAFRAILGNKVGDNWQVDLTYLNAVKTAILDACPHTTTQGSTWGLDFTKPRWTNADLYDSNPGFTTAEYINQIMIAYIYVEPYFTTDQKTKIKQWFNEAANYFSINIGNASNKQGINSVFVDRWNGNYNFAPGYNAGGYSSDYTHDGGYRIRQPQKIFNNRRGAIARMITYNGFINNNAEHKKLGELFFKDTFKYGTYPNGFFSDMERGWNYPDHEEGLGYCMAFIPILADIADLFARSGDTSLYDYETSFGVYGTEGGPKSLKRSINEYARIFAKTVTYTNGGQLLDGQSSRFISAQDAFWSKANMYFKDSWITQVYRRQLPGQNPIPADPNDNGPVPTYMGPGGLVPGYNFMYDGVNVNPYPSKNFFQLNQSATTSAGVYKKDGTKVRALWDLEVKGAGKHGIYWDGKDDTGAVMPDGEYDVKVLSNNVNLVWEGTIGNNSTTPNGYKLHRSFERPHCIAIAGNYAWVGNRYDEGKQSHIKMDLANLKERINVLTHIYFETSMETNAVCSDGSKVYFGGRDPFAGNKSFVFAVDAGTGNEVSFSSGQGVTMTHGGRTYISAINVKNVSDSYIWGMAVQKTGDYLFVARTGLNQIDVINKNTGAYVRTITHNDCKYLVCSNNHLWIQSLTQVKKYQVNSDGTLTDLEITLSGLVDPQGLGCSPDGSLISVCDGGSSQQVKTYSTTNGALQWTLGQAGGYSTNSTAANDKFYFNDPRGRQIQSGIAYLNDGSFLLIDGGNYRIQKFSASRVYQDTVMWMPHIWSETVMQTDPTRAFIDTLEFSIDYSKPVRQGWTFTKNWGYNLTTAQELDGVPDGHAVYTRLIFATKLSNGRTYACQFNGSNYEVFELVEGGTMRATGSMFGKNHQRLHPNGDVVGVKNIGIGQQAVFYKRPLTGFVNNNPQWGAEVAVQTAPTRTNQDPIYPAVRNTTLAPHEITSSGALISYDGNSLPWGSEKWHLGALKNNKWLWRALPATFVNYTGEFPLDAYELGNYTLDGNGHMTGYSGTRAMVMGNLIVAGYHGEFWKGRQVCRHYVFHESGLQIGTYGTDTWEIELGGDAYGAPVMAGNCFMPSLVKVGSDIYLYYNDESFNGGLHRAKFTGLETIQEFTVPVKLNGAVPAQNDGIDLMAGLGTKGAQLSDGNGWTRNPSVDNTTHVTNNWWQVRTQKKHHRLIDVWAKFSQNTAQNYTVSRDLGNHTNASSWSIKGSISFDENTGNNAAGNGCHLEVLDSTGKVLVRFYHGVVFGGSFVNTVYGNGVIIGTGSEKQMRPILYKHQKIEITCDANGVRFAYAGFSPVTVPILDSSGNRLAPKTLRMSFFHSSGTNYQRAMSFTGKLYV